MGMCMLRFELNLQVEGQRIYIKHCISFIIEQVSGLFARDEMDEILNELIVPMKKDFPRRPPTNENLYDYYLSRCRANLHVVLCFSPVSKSSNV